MNRLKRRIKKYSQNERSTMYFKIAIVTYLVIQFFIVIGLLVFSVMINAPGPSFLLFTVVSFSPILMLIIFSIGALVTSITSYFISKRYLKPLENLSNVSKEVAKGNFSVRVDENAEFKELRTTLSNFNVMVEELSKVETLSNSFLSNVSHEFKTPLSVIRSNVNLLQNGNLTKVEEEKYLNEIDNHVEKLSSLVSNVLRICKLDDPNTKINKTNFRLDEQIRQCICYFDDQLETKNINLDLDLDDMIINSDEEILSQVWTNIISNAIKFSKQDGMIKISLKQNDASMVEVKIADNGEGMVEEDRKRIFDRFYQGETSHQKEGNGLGLSIVGSICKRLNIKIEVESQINLGTTFTFIFDKDDYRQTDN